jgi:hypothetical protein
MSKHKTERYFIQDYIYRGKTTSGTIQDKVQLMGGKKGFIQAWPIALPTLALKSVLVAWKDQIW